jgi:uncharacterized lipoprotein YmbA
MSSWLRNSRPAWAASAIAAAVLLTACQSAPTTLYTLVSSPPSVTRPTYDGPAVRVEAVHLPPALDRNEVVTSVAAGQLQLHDDAHWAAPLSKTARQALTEDLLARLPEGRTVFPQLPAPPGTLGITVDVLVFQAGRNGASLQASWTVAATGAGSPASSGTVLLRTEQSGADPAGTARALSTLLGQLADRIVAALPN